MKKKIRKIALEISRRFMSAFSVAPPISKKGRKPFAKDPLHGEKIMDWIISEVYG
jgi:hypothetical protein